MSGLATGNAKVLFSLPIASAIKVKTREPLDCIHVCPAKSAEGCLNHVKDLLVKRTVVPFLCTSPVWITVFVPTSRDDLQKSFVKRKPSEKETSFAEGCRNHF